MRTKVREKEKAIKLRKKGLSYKEILQRIPVAKSSLSLWLKDLPMTKNEKKALRKRKNARIINGRSKAAEANRNRRLEREKNIFNKAMLEFEKHSSEPFFHFGISMYWAEGSKRSSEFRFTNSDPKVMKLMTKWIERYLCATKEVWRARLYIHKPYAHENCEKFWIGVTGIPQRRFGKTIYKPTGLKVKKRPNYKGCLCISLKKEELLKMKFWQEKLIDYYSENK